MVSAVFLLLRRRLEQRAAPELVAVLRLLTLIATAILPVALAVCAAAILSAERHGASRALGGVLYLLVVAVSVRFLWVAVRKVRVSRAATISTGQARSLRRIPLGSGQPVLVVPVAEPLAYTAGFPRGQIVVSQGVLDLLDGRERRALLAHELAHLRGGHQRMLLVGEVITGALGLLPPVRSAVASLRRSIEITADTHAVAVVGDRRVVARAIVKMALAAQPVAGVALAGPCDLRERLERLLKPQPCSRGASAIFAVAGMLVVGAVVASACLAIHAGALPLTVLACLGVLSALALPPLSRLRVQTRSSTIL